MQCMISWFVHNRPCCAHHPCCPCPKQQPTDALGGHHTDKGASLLPNHCSLPPASEGLGKQSLLPVDQHLKKSGNGNHLCEAGCKKLVLCQISPGCRVLGGQMQCMVPLFISVA